MKEKAIKKDKAMERMMKKDEQLIKKINAKSEQTIKRLG
jgi:hypothetical protein